MKTNIRHIFPLTAIAAGLFAASGTVWAAEDDEVTQLIKPESTVQIGIGFVDNDNRRFGQYNGLTDDGAYGLLDADIVKRDDATGTWLKLKGRNLGLDNRELRFEHNKQGDWGYFIDYSQTPRFEPFVPTTAVTGIGSANLSVPSVATAGVPVPLKTEREAIGLGLEKMLPAGFDVQVRFRNEEKDGARIFARGTTGGTGRFQFTPEPIDSTTMQLETTLGYTGDNLQISSGYYGTSYDNHNTALNITEVGAATGLAGFTPIGLPPDNQSHQLFLSGGYSFTPTTRGTFKAAYTQQTQDDTFILSSATGRTDLGGRVDTTLLQAGLTARPLPKLSLLANMRYEDRDDQTPIVDYFPVTVTTTATGENEPRSIRTISGKAEASYALPLDFRVTGGVDYDEKKRNTSPVRVVSHRDTTEETSYRMELRRSMSETVTGALAYVHSERDGSPFLTTTLSSGAVGSNLIAPLHLADRERDKVRLTVDWTPTEPLSLQFLVDEARDVYSARTDKGLGPQSGKAYAYSIDASYTFTDTWQGTAWVSRNDTRIEQATCRAASTAGVCPATAVSPLWAATMRNLGDSFGLGVRGTLTEKLDIGADLTHSEINDEYRQETITPGATVSSLPDVSTRISNLQLFAKYAVQKNAGVRLDYIYDRFKTDDWTWTTWTYTDGTQLVQSPLQQVHFIGVSGYYQWQ